LRRQSIRFNRSIIYPVNYRWSNLFLLILIPEKSLFIDIKEDEILSAKAMLADVVR
jgi:hypothetical protein